jgi:hypothetical protein
MQESDAGQAPSFFDGERSSINTTHGKFLTYPGAHNIQGSFTLGSPGVITLNVPVADVGGQPQSYPVFDHGPECDASDCIIDW